MLFKFDNYIIFNMDGSKWSNNWIIEFTCFIQTLDTMPHGVHIKWPWKVQTISRFSILNDI